MKDNDQKLIWEAYLQESHGVDRAAQAALQEYANYKERWKAEEDAMVDRTNSVPGDPEPDDDWIEKQRAEAKAIGIRLSAELDLNLKKIIAEMPIDPERPEHRPARDLWLALSNAADNEESLFDNEIQQFAHVLGFDNDRIQAIATRIGNFGNWQGN